MISQSDATEEIARYCRHFGRGPGAINPATLEFVFGPSVWLRGLIKPPPDTASPTSIGHNRNSELPRPLAMTAT